MIQTMWGEADSLFDMWMPDLGAEAVGALRSA